MNAWDHLNHFRRSEFGAHADKMSLEFMAILDRAREMAGVPFVVTDSWRPDDPDEHSAHELGKAVDLRCHEKDNYTRFLIVKAAILMGIDRLGVYDRHLHLDIGTPAEGFPAQRLWLGKSK